MPASGRYPQPRPRPSGRSGSDRSGDGHHCRRMRQRYQQLRHGYQRRGSQAGRGGRAHHLHASALCAVPVQRGGQGRGLRHRHDGSGRQEARGHPDGRRHALRGHQVRAGPEHRQVRRRRGRYDDQAGAGEGHRLFRPLLQRNAGVADQEGRRLLLSRVVQGQEARDPVWHHRQGLRCLQEARRGHADRVRGPRDFAAGTGHQPDRRGGERSACVDRLHQEERRQVRGRCRVRHR